MMLQKKLHVENTDQGIAFDFCIACYELVQFVLTDFFSELIYIMVMVHSRLDHILQFGYYLSIPPFDSHLKSNVSIWTKFYVSQLHSGW